MEEKTEKKEQTQVAEMLAIFNSGWETVVDLVVRLFGLTREAARNMILVAIVPLLTAAVQIVNWLYLYMHYHLGYNVPVACLTVDTSWLVNFGVGVLSMVAVALVTFYVERADIIKKQWPAVLLLVGIVAGFATVGLLLNHATVEIPYLVIRGIIWLLLIATTLLLFSKRDKRNSCKKRMFFATVVFDLISVGIICLWLLGSHKFSQNLNLCAPIVAFWFFAMCCWNIFAAFRLQQEGLFPRRIQICLLSVLAVFAFFLCDDWLSRMAPFAMVENQQQAIVYQNANIAVLEKATVSENTIMIDTSQQQIVDSTTLSYEYQSFDTVNIE